MYRRSIVSLSRLWWTMYGAMYLAIALGMSSAATTRSSRRNTIVAMVSCETAKVLHTIYFLTWTFQEKKRFDSSGVRIMTLSTEKKRLLEMDKNSPPSFKELRQISGSFVQVWTVLSDFWPLCPFLCTSVGFRTLSFDFELFRPISDIIVRFQMAIIRFWIIASVSGHFHPFSNTFRQMLRDHPIACFRPI